MRSLRAVTTLAQSTAGFLSQPAFGLRRFLLIALLLRLPAVLCADGFEFADQQFQYIEPAWHFASGDDWQPTWEWLDGIRSEVYPDLLAGIFRVLVQLGGDAPLPLMTAVRAVHAVLSLLPMAVFWLLVVRWRPVHRPRLALLLFAASGIGVQASVQPSGPTVSAVLAVTAVLAAHGPGRWPFAAGIALGLSFCCRCQDAVFGVGIAGSYLVTRHWRGLGWFALGCVPPILLQGGLDLVTHGAFLATPFAYVRANLVDGASSKWRTQPFWYYAAYAVLPTLVLVPGLLRPALRSLHHGARVVPIAVAAAAVHLVLHSCVARKALRFATPSLWLLIAVIAIGLTAAATDRAARWHRRAVVTVQLLLLLYATCWFGHAGAIRSALALRAEPTFTDELLVVDGDVTSTAGNFYCRRPHLAIVGVPGSGLAAAIAALPPRPHRWLLISRQPLPANTVRDLGAVCHGTYPGWLDLRAADRRFVYRIDTQPGK